MTEMSAAEAVFFAALAKADPADRAAYLNEACGTDADLRRQVDRLLAAHPQVGSFLQDDAAPHPLPRGGVGREVRAGATVDAPVSERPGTVIGPYKLLQQLGEGGMGVVWMAEQTQPVQRKVALKVIKPGMDSRQVIARFEAERQALALMDHVNIARVFDGGATENGRPYFVMELVHGVPITKYCDDNHLTPRERLELFVPVCQAIQHAHQKGIIHRDIKPSNVMVTLYDGKPVPKVIDFGVAKATEQKLTDRTLFTQYGTMVGTLEYMSPEQAEMSALGVDTRSDIYSLGVLLYELLTGSTPLTRKRMKEAAYADILRMIKDEEPQKPSTRLSDSGEALASISAQRKTEPAKLAKLVRGELDWIAMKCLEKDRNRRYETANGFAADVLRYLNDEPVQACPPSAGYRFRKFARRNRRALVTASVIGLALLLGVGALGWVVRDREAGRMRTANEVNQFLQRAESLYADSKLPEAVAEVEKARGVMEAGSGDEELGRRVRKWLDDLDTAMRLEEIQIESFEGQDRGYTEFARLFREHGIDVETLPTEDVTARIIASRIRLDLVFALGTWAARLKWDPRPQDAIRWQRLKAIWQAADPDPWRMRWLAAVEAKDVQTVLEIVNGADSARTRTRVLAHLGESLRVAGDAEAAVAFLRKAQHQHPGDFLINSGLANCLVELNPPPWDEVLAFRRVAQGARPQSIWARNALGIALKNKGRLEEAISVFHEIIRLRPGYVHSHANLGDSLVGQKNLDAAIASYRKAIELDPRSVYAHNGLGIALKEQGKLDAAIAAFEKAIAIDPKYALAHFNLGLALRAGKKLDAAIPAYEKAIELNPKYAPAYTALGNALSVKGILPEAIAAYEKAIAIDAKYALAHLNLGLVLYDFKKLPEAIAAHEKAIAIDPKFARAYLSLGNARRAQWDLDRAIAAYRRAIELDPNLARTRTELSIALAQKGWDLANPDPKWAVAASKEAVELAPLDGLAWMSLGWVQYRAGDWKASIEALRKSCDLNKGGDFAQWIVMSLAHWQLASEKGLAAEDQARHRAEARRWYERAVKQIDSRWKDRPNNVIGGAIWDFRAEALKLMRPNEESK